MFEGEELALLITARKSDKLTGLIKKTDNYSMSLLRYLACYKN